MTETNDKLVDVKPLRPFVGSYRCGLSEADYIDDDIAEKDGLIVKVKVPRKRFIGLISVQRLLRSDEIQAALSGDLPPNIELVNKAQLQGVKPGMTELPAIQCVEHPRAGPTVRVPMSLADRLVERGLAEHVKQSRK